MCASLPEAFKAFAVDSSDLWDKSCEYDFPSLTVCLAVGQRQLEEDGLLSLRTSVWTDFRTTRAPCSLTSAFMEMPQPT